MRLTSLLAALLVATPALAADLESSTQTLKLPKCVDIDPRDGKCDDGEGLAIRGTRFVGDHTLGDDIDIPDELFHVALGSERMARVESFEERTFLVVTDEYTGQLLSEVRSPVPLTGIQAAVSFEQEDVLILIDADQDGHALFMAPPQQQGDHCEEEGWYGDGICDDCPNPDPDCGADQPEPDGGDGGDDWCAEIGWYGDGICDADCPNPDPDCS